ncbi:dihydrofolate reductase [bacterium]|nr:dihydrofolate reductase [bacterium]
MSRKVIVYIASSLDGYIAAPNDDLSFLDAVQVEGEDYGYAAFYSSIDTVIIGRKTYDWVRAQLGFNPHKDKKTYVITNDSSKTSDEVTYYSGDLNHLITKLKSSEGLAIYCDGGAQLVNSLLIGGHIDEIIMSVIPVVLGDGIRLFHEKLPKAQLRLLHSKSYETGLVQLHYQVLK